MHRDTDKGTNPPGMGIGTIGDTGGMLTARPATPIGDMSRGDITTTMVTLSTTTTTVTATVMVMATVTGSITVTTLSLTTGASGCSFLIDGKRAQKSPQLRGLEEP